MAEIVFILNILWKQAKSQLIGTSNLLHFYAKHKCILVSIICQANQ